MNSHLLFDGTYGGTVAAAKASVLIHVDLRDDEQRDTLDAFGPAFDLGQHQMDDVVGHVMLARGDEDLLAGDLIAAVFLWHRFGAHQAQIGAAVGLRQVHGAGPFAADHFGQVHVLLRIRAMGKDGRGRTVGQALIHGERLVCGREHLAHGGAHDVGHALTAILLGHVQTCPTALAHLIEGRFEAGRRVDDAVFQTAAFLVAHRIQGGQYIRGQLARFLKDRGGEIGFQIGVARDARRGNVQNVMQNELHVFGWGGVCWHWFSLPET